MNAEGTKALVYNAARLTADPPTRLHIDAQTVTWMRGMGFHPVLNERDQVPVVQLENSLLNLMLQLKKDNPLPTSDLLPETFDIRLDHEYICTTIEDFEAFKKKYPLWGMPYALPALNDKERETIIRWLRQGARITPKPAAVRPDDAGHQHVGGVFKRHLTQGTVDVPLSLRASVHWPHPFRIPA